MFFDFFGLDRNPFRSRVSGSDVFVGPQQANLIGSLKKALTAGDSVVALTGPVGVGKTTIVNRALGEISSNARVARIGRIRVRREEVPEMLLAELGAERVPSSTVQQFAELKRLLNQCADDDIRIFIVVEDASTIGNEVLAELESLTSADSGDTPGANIILMGPEALRNTLRDPFLARLRQRVLLRPSVQPLSVAEVRGYLAHSLRQAGGDIDAVFADGTVDAISDCADGIPRIVNNLVQAVMTLAADAASDTVTVEHVRDAARDDFGAEAARPTGDSSAASVPEAPARAAHDNFDVPDLIQDTQPELKALSPPDEPAEGIRPQDLAPLRDKTDETQPSLPVLTLDDPHGATDTALSGAEAKTLAAEEQRMLLEPRAPEPLTADPADTQTIRALDSALRPDTQLLEALDGLPPEIEDNSAVPLGLQDQVGSPVGGSQTLPTLSESMRLDAPPTPAPIPAADDPAGTADGEKKPNIDKLEAALAIARKGPIDLSAEPDSPAMPAQPSAPPVPPPAADPAPANDLPDLSTVPEITLDGKIEQAKEAARTKLAEEAEKLARQKEDAEATKKAAVEAARPKTHPAEVDFGSISDQLAADDTLTAPPTPRTDQTGAYAALEDGEEQDAEDTVARQKLEKLAENLSSATSLEEIDDLAAETLFGEEFSEMAAQVAAMAANDMDNAEDVVNQPAVAARNQPAVAAQGQAAAQNTIPPVATPATPAPIAKAPAANPAPSAAGSANVAPPTPPATNPAVAPPTASPTMPPTRPDIDSSAARRLEMVRSLNQSKAPKTAPPSLPPEKPEEIVLGDQDSSPTYSGPQPEPIENQFGTSMTATLKALSETSMNAIPKDEIVETEEKKGGLLSRFKRS